MYITTTMCDGVLHCLLFLMFFWCPYMAINVDISVVIYVARVKKCSVVSGSVFAFEAAFF